MSAPSVFLAVADAIVGRLAGACDLLQYGSPNPTPDTSTAPRRVLWAELGDSRRATDWLGEIAWTTELRISLECRTADAKPRSAIALSEAMLAEVVNLLAIPSLPDTWAQSIADLGVEVTGTDVFLPRSLGRDLRPGVVPIAIVSFSISIPHRTAGGDLSSAPVTTPATPDPLQP